MNGMIEDQIREIKDNLCVNCGDRICCHGIQSCKDASFYEAKVLPVKNDAELYDILSAEISK